MEKTVLQFIKSLLGKKWEWLSLEEQKEISELSEFMTLLKNCKKNPRTGF